MTRFRRDLVAGVCIFVSLVAVVLYAATGGRWYSRHPDEQLTAMNQESELSSLFTEQAETTAATGEVASEYTFGLLPGGPNPIDIWSVATVAGPALAIAGAAHLLHRRRKRASAQAQE